ncbi:cytochrome c oxidase assembly protein [Neorhizobium galegae]|uniref:cytochrome c oxidase assembly protein n=1 Tax=Neorhizobium galegae TaxID=399 RepID=UPI000621CE29|nr:cytochrome c oxidase assembly protein [Neorhizobium galegae]CDZ28724.1 Cytochrome c oxidase assembly protein CtaG [Neorhizobium galegae bv. officinalis]KAA9386187.1 cytochrome c oxidase assembly protein [Neorhizobium galegae]KAB1113371.1 cytochrome c oxidase assembly protein [Neorhizobium galegae]MCM2496324.1 cytochrome c oxidase assembly protein [Neorhizobium galegae]MCQ1770540.1 cytochrome c oxidase assembly protein [Neorhizobium galegae]
MTDVNQNGQAKRVSNSAIFAGCAVFVAGMVGAAYASVPLYRLFCQVTGYNGTTQRVEQYSDKILNKPIQVTFDANISPGLNWEFKPAKSVNPKIGETVQIEYTATNRSSKPTTGSAVFNVTPMEAGAYFNKVECFCFTEQTLQPGQSVQMPVVFFVDPEIATAQETKNIKTITLSYTFYPSEPGKPVAALPEGPKAGAPKTGTGKL